MLFEFLLSVLAPDFEALDTLRVERAVQVNRAREGFTLLEVLMAIGILGIIAAIVLVAINPKQQLGAAGDAGRTNAAAQLQKGEFQYLIDHGQYAADKPIPEGQANALPICRQGRTDPGCINVDALLSGYIACIPHDLSEPNLAFSGYRIHQDAGRVSVTAMYVGSGSTLADCGDSVPPIPTVGLALWLKADALDLNNNDPVGRWMDASGQGNDASQTVASSKPLYKTNVLNGKPVIRFDGTDDGLQGRFATPLTSSSATILLVSKPDATLRQNLWGLMDSPTQTSGIYNNFAIEEWKDTSPDKFTVAKGDGTTSFNVSRYVNYPDNAFSLWSITTSGNTVKIYYDQGAATTLTATGSVALANYMLAGATWSGNSRFKGDLAEFIVYSRTLTDAERVIVESYLHAKYAIVP